jgi:hypothetical protein
MPLALSNEIREDCDWVGHRSCETVSLRGNVNAGSSVRRCEDVVAEERSATCVPVWCPECRTASSNTDRLNR